MASPPPRWTRLTAGKPERSARYEPSEPAKNDRWAQPVGMPPRIGEGYFVAGPGQGGVVELRGIEVVVSRIRPSPSSPYNLSRIIMV
jgi:hypothetical protein